MELLRNSVGTERHFSSPQECVDALAGSADCERISLVEYDGAVFPVATTQWSGEIKGGVATLRTPAIAIHAERAWIISLFSDRPHAMRTELSKIRIKTYSSRSEILAVASR